MSIEKKLMDPVQDPAWDMLVQTSRYGSFFHTSHWANVLTASYRYRPCYFAWVEDGALRAAVPVMEVDSILTGRRGVSLPFTDHCEPLLAEDVTLEELLPQLLDYGRLAGWRFLEIRGGTDSLDRSHCSSLYYGHTLDLTAGETALFAGLRKSTQRNVRKAAGAGLTLETRSTPESLRTFYQMNCLTRKAHGIPPQPWVFFKQLFDHVLSKGRGRLVLARHEGTPVAGALFLHFGTQAIFKFGASNRKYQQLRANNFILWETIRWYAARGYKSLCLGRSEPEHTGLLQFKRGWGAEEKVRGYYKYDLIQNRFVSSPVKNNGFAEKVFGVMPVPVARWMGEVLYRHVG